MCACVSLCFTLSVKEKWTTQCCWNAHEPSRTGPWYVCLVFRKKIQRTTKKCLAPLWVIIAACVKIEIFISIQYWRIMHCFNQSVCWGVSATCGWRQFVDLFSCSVVVLCMWVWQALRVSCSVDTKHSFCVHVNDDKNSWQKWGFFHFKFIESWILKWSNGKNWITLSFSFPCYV